MFPQEGKSIRSSSGFSGKGFKFDETEHALANERKKLQKAALGLHDSDDDDAALDVSLNRQHHAVIIHSLLHRGLTPHSSHLPVKLAPVQWCSVALVTPESVQI